MQFQINFGSIVAVRLRARSELDFGNVSYVTALRSHDFFLWHDATFSPPSKSSWSCEELNWRSKDKRSIFFMTPIKECTKETSGI